jgi:ABC-type nitrate/sulfonate/bicarbonate transport system substrate-binding protein
MEAPMMKKRPVFSMILSIVAGLLAVLPAAEAAKLRLGVHRSVNGVPDVVAHRLGYFKKYGLLYTTNYFKQGKVVRNAVIQNNLDTAGGVGFSPFSLAVAKGAGRRHRQGGRYLRDGENSRQARI